MRKSYISLVTDQRGIPVFMEPLSGNISDKKTLIRTITEVRQNLNVDHEVYHMVDSALYSADSVQKLGAHCNWITRVPENIKEASDIISSDVEWTSCEDDRYNYAFFTSRYGDVDQR